MAPFLKRREKKKKGGGRREKKKKGEKNDSRDCARYQHFSTLAYRF